MDENNKNPDHFRKKEYQKNPYANLRDTSDRMKTGDLAQISNLGCMPILIVLAVLIIILFIFSK